jgi:hypothetical protein
MDISPCEPGVRLGDLSFSSAHLVVRKHQVTAAALDVETRAQSIERNRGALDVPARSTAAQRGIPGGVVRAFGLPEQAIEWVALTGAFGVSPTLSEDPQHLLTVPTGDRAEGRVRAHREVQVSSSH